MRQTLLSELTYNFTLDQIFSLEVLLPLPASCFSEDFIILSLEMRVAPC